MDVALQHYPPVARDARDLLDYAIQEAGRFAIIPELSEASRVEYRMESGVDYDPEESRATWRELAVSLGPLLVQSVLGQAPDGTDFWREADEIAERTEASAP